MCLCSSHRFLMYWLWYYASLHFKSTLMIYMYALLYIETVICNHMFFFSRVNRVSTLMKSWNYKLRWLNKWRKKILFSIIKHYILWLVCDFWLDSFFLCWRVVTSPKESERLDQKERERERERRGWRGREEKWGEVEGERVRWVSDVFCFHLFSWQTRKYRESDKSWLTWQHKI